MGVIATRLPAATHMQRLRAAIRDRHELVECDSWESLEDVCSRQPIRIVVVDLYDAGILQLDAVRKLRHRFPRLTVIAYVSVSADRIQDVFDAGRMGLDALVVADRDDGTRILLTTLRLAESRSLGSAVRLAIEHIDLSVREAVLLCVTRAHERLSPETLAHLLALSRRTMAARLAQAGFPPPQRLITWGRLIVAAHMLSDRHRSANAVAMALGFPSASAFRNTCQRYLHATPDQIRARGGSTFAMQVFLRTAVESQQSRARPAPSRRIATSRWSVTH